MKKRRPKASADLFAHIEIRHAYGREPLADLLLILGEGEAQLKQDSGLLRQQVACAYDSFGSSVIHRSRTSACRADEQDTLLNRVFAGGLLRG